MRIKLRAFNQLWSYMEVNNKFIRKVRLPWFKTPKFLPYKLVTMECSVESVEIKEAIFEFSGQKTDKGCPIYDLTEIE